MAPSFAVDSGGRHVAAEATGVLEEHSRCSDTCAAPFLRQLVLGMRCGVLAIDREGRLAMVNDQAREILELDEAPPIGVPVGRALRDLPQLARILRDAFTLESLPNRAEIDLHCSAHRRKTLGFTLSMIGGDSGSADGAAIFFKDLTPVEQKEEQERLKDRLAALGQMAANMAHEIRNPLASIEVACGLLNRRLGGSDEAKALLEKIVSEVRRLNGTISSSLEFVRPLTLRPGPTDLAEVLEQALGVARGRARAPEIEVVNRAGIEVPSFVADAGALRQVFENLFLNAMEAMGERGTLTVETALVPAPAAASIPYLPADGRGDEPSQSFDSYVEVRVSDTGPGISEEHLDKLFYPFFTTKQAGSGVGLPMAKKIVDSHGGLLDVASRPDEGAEFIVRVPLIRSGEDGSR